MTENAPTSKTPVVRVLMRFQGAASGVWRFAPKWLCRRLLRWFRGGEGMIAYGVRYLCVQRLAKRCGRKVIIFPYVYLMNPQNLELGTNVSIHQFCYLEAIGGLQIGDDVAIAHGCSVLTFDHEIADLEGSMKDAPSACAPVRLGNDVWIGCGVRILKGVTINDGAVVGAGSVVTRDIPPLAVAAGVPARVVRTRPAQKDAAPATPGSAWSSTRQVD